MDDCKVEDPIDKVKNTYHHQSTCFIPARPVHGRIPRGVSILLFHPRSAHPERRGGCWQRTLRPTDRYQHAALHVRPQTALWPLLEQRQHLGPPAPRRSCSGMRGSGTRTSLRHPVHVVFLSFSTAPWRVPTSRVSLISLVTW